MSTPTIGYEDDTTLSRSEIARVQLVEAVALFVTEKFLPALTLAGAAEEILGKLLVRQSQQPVIKESMQAITQLRVTTGLSVMGNKPEREVVAGWNSARNAAKHLGENDIDPVTLNLCDEAYWMIRRALENAKKLGLAVENQVDFENWFIINCT